MKIGIMQPYLFPYIGYYQLMNIVDVYVILDEVQYISQGFMNRNYLLPVLETAEKYRFTFSVRKDSMSKQIMERFFSAELDKDRQKLLSYLNIVYSKAPYFRQTMEILQDILFYDNRNVSAYLSNSLIQLARYMGIQSKIYIQSQIPEPMLHEKFYEKDKRIFTISNYFGADHYINAIGGRALYDKENFGRHSLKLDFIRRGDVKYRQFTEKFVPDLSIIDVLMFNPLEVVQEMLNQYELVEE